MRNAKPEATARAQIIEALDIDARPTAAMPEGLRARILANRPSADEIANGKWTDGNLASVKNAGGPPQP